MYKNVAEVKKLAGESFDEPFAAIGVSIPLLWVQQQAFPNLKPMRVALVVHAFPPEGNHGVENHTRALARALAAAEVGQMAPGQGGQERTNNRGQQCLDD